jgi:hypothetical protein
MLMVYGKGPTDKKFRPMDYHKGVLVNNKIHATMFDEDKKAQLETSVNYMNENNPGYTFEIRTVK